VGCLSLLLLVAVALAVWVWQDSKRGWTVTKLESLLAVEIQVGCDRQHVEAWLDKHEIQHSYWADTTGDRSGHSTMPMLAGLRDEDLSGMVRGWIKGSEANLGFLENGEIRVYFFFDKQGACVGHWVVPFVFSF